MDLTERPRLQTAKWGAACAPCAAAKAKCIRSDETPGAKCERCERLLKECAGQVHRPRKKRQAKPSRTAQIEERLNGLVNLLKASGELGNAQTVTSSQSSIDDERAIAGASGQQTPLSSPSTSNQSNCWSVDPYYNASTPKFCICHSDNDEDVPPPPDSDEALLDFYRETLQPIHPFVVIPPTVTAAALKTRKPFLMAAIRMASSFRSLRSMRAQMYHLMKYIADHMLIRSEKSMDLLLGIIVMLGYQQYHCCVHAQLNNLISLALTLVDDLGLCRPPGPSERTRLMVVRPPEPMFRTNEERRAFAGAWYWSSVMAMSFGRSEYMRYSNYLQECVRHLEAEREYESDVALIYLIRIQRLTERIAEINSEDRAVEDISPIPTAPVSAYISAFQNELDCIRNSMPGNLKTDKTFRLFLDSARLHLYEPPVVDKSLINSLSKSLASVSIGAVSPLDRMYQSSAALTAWFDTWLSVPVNEYYHQTTAMVSQLAYAVTMLGRWARLATPRTMYEGQTPMPDDPSANNPNVDLYHASEVSSTQCESSIETSSNTSSLAAAVAILRSQLQTQPGLMVNIPEILSAICARFEQANATFQFFSTDADKLLTNVWMISALKVRIARAKLERWAELVSAGAEALSLENRPGGVDDGGDMKIPAWYGSFHQQRQQQQQQQHEQASGSGGGLDDLGPFQDATMEQNQQMDAMFGSTPWTSDLLSGVDPSLWFDGHLDWGAVIMNSMGSVER